VGCPFCRLSGGSGLLTTISDISGRNIAFTCSHLSNATEQQLFDVLEAPETEPLARIDGMPLPNGLPTQLVKAAEWIDWIDEDDEDIHLLDFGESFVQGQEPYRLAQPGSLRVPETIFTDVFDYRIDLWRAGCMVSCLRACTRTF
jgi:serine/threonine-protein kinase SRPK3